MNSNIVLIIPYFGKFNNYFDLWLKSVEYNKNIDFLLITDNTEVYNYPPNLKIIYQTFLDVQKRIKYLFKKAKINTPYKVCDYKPVYNLIFREYVEQYEFWGYCDMDLIFGDIRLFVTDEILENFDKIYTHGHLTIFRNCERVNKLILNDTISLEYYTYNEAFRTNYVCHFDEWSGVSKIFDKCLKNKQYNETDFADINPNVYSFEIFYNEMGKKCIFKWENGRLFSMYLNSNNITCKEYMYVHLQKRSMSMAEKMKDIENIIIVPNQFLINKFDIDKDFILNNTKERKYLGFKRKRIRQIIFNIKNGALQQRLYRKYKKIKYKNS